MGDMQNWFTTMGLLKVAILEVADIIPPPPTSTKRRKTADSRVSMVHCRVAIRDDSGNELRNRDTALQHCYTDSSADSLRIGEEFVFNRVLSSSVVHLSVRFFDLLEQCTHVIGTVSVPVARLEENIKVHADCLAQSHVEFERLTNFLLSSLHNRWTVLFCSLL